MAQLRDAYESFRSEGADIAVIGMGTPEEAREFKERRAIPFRLLVDRTRDSYRAVEARRSVGGALGPKVWLPGAKSLLSGHSQAPARQDWRQLGATAVVAQGGRVLLLHRSEHAADNPPIDELLEALA